MSFIKHRLDHPLELKLLKYYFINIVVVFMVFDLLIIFNVISEMSCNFTINLARKKKIYIYIFDF